MSAACRPDGWELRLDRLIGEARRQPFGWGRHDCALFAAAVVNAIAGAEVVAGWRGAYATALGARRTLARMGHADLMEAVSARLGPPLPSALMAQRGDVVMSRDARALGVCIGRDALFLAPDGLTALPLTAAGAAWRV